MNSAFALQMDTSLSEGYQQNMSNSCNYQQHSSQPRNYTYRDDDSMNSSVMNEGQSRRHYNQHHTSSDMMLMLNQFRIENQPDIITVQTSNMLCFGYQ